jgi:hypothetical protein
MKIIMREDRNKVKKRGNKQNMRMRTTTRRKMEQRK